MAIKRQRGNRDRCHGVAVPMPTNVRQVPQPSTTVNGTCMATPGVDRWIVNVTADVPAGGLYVLPTGNALPAMVICCTLVAVPGL